MVAAARCRPLWWLALALAVIATGACATGDTESDGGRDVVASHDVRVAPDVTDPRDATDEATRDGATCSDVRSDPLNCGTCGHACAAGELCFNGLCQASCPPGYSNCADGCVRLASDPTHCGSCAITCAATEVCSAGRCGATCAAPLMSCTPSGARPYCADLNSEVRNCGACGTTCPIGQLCTSGHCGTTGCPAGQTACGAACVDLQTDRSNCGACATACATAGTCVAGRCCTTSTYQHDTGPISGTAMVCCDGSDRLVSVTDCGSGMNHSVRTEGSCGVAVEGAMNGGSACARIDCERVSCM